MQSLSTGPLSAQEARADYYYYFRPSESRPIEGQVRESVKPMTVEDVHIFSLSGSSEPDREHTCSLTLTLLALGVFVRQ